MSHQIRPRRSFTIAQRFALAAAITLSACDDGCNTKLVPVDAEIGLPLCILAAPLQGEHCTEGQPVLFGVNATPASAQLQIDCSSTNGGGTYTSTAVSDERLAVLLDDGGDTATWFELGDSGDSGDTAGPHTELSSERFDETATWLAVENIPQGDFLCVPSVLSLGSTSGTPDESTLGAMSFPLTVEAPVVGTPETPFAGLSSVAPGSSFDLTGLRCLYTLGTGGSELGDGPVGELDARSGATVDGWVLTVDLEATELEACFTCPLAAEDDRLSCVDLPVLPAPTLDVELTPGQPSISDEGVVLTVGVTIDDPEATTSVSLTVDGEIYIFDDGSCSIEVASDSSVSFPDVETRYNGQIGEIVTLEVEAIDQSTAAVSTLEKVFTVGAIPAQGTQLRADERDSALLAYSLVDLGLFDGDFTIRILATLGSQDGVYLVVGDEGEGEFIEFSVIDGLLTVTLCGMTEADEDLSDPVTLEAQLEQDTLQEIRLRVDLDGAHLDLNGEEVCSDGTSPWFETLSAEPLILAAVPYATFSAVSIIPGYPIQGLPWTSPCDHLDERSACFDWSFAEPGAEYGEGDTLPDASGRPAEVLSGSYTALTSQ